jgi:hypothetical protein
MGVLHSTSAAEQMHNERNDGDDEQQMNSAARDMECKPGKRPHGQQKEEQKQETKVSYCAHLSLLTQILLQRAPLLSSSLLKGGALPETVRKPFANVPSHFATSRLRSNGPVYCVASPQSGEHGLQVHEIPRRGGGCRLA